MNLLEKNLNNINLRTKDLVHMSKRILQNNIIPNNNHLLLELIANPVNLINNNKIWVDKSQNSPLTLTNITYSDGALILNGVNSEINTNIPQADLVKGYTIGVRFYSEDWSNYRGLWGIHTGSNLGLLGLQANASAPGMGISHHGGYCLNIPYAKLLVNHWHTVIFTYSVMEDSIAVVNGTEFERSRAFTKLNPTGNLLIGRGYNHETRYFKGKLSHFILYNRTMNVEEMFELENYIKSTIYEVV